MAEGGIRKGSGDGIGIQCAGQEEFVVEKVGSSEWKRDGGTSSTD